MKSYYRELVAVEDREGLDSHIIESLEVMWESKVPSKIKVFVWRFLLDRLPTRDQLIIRYIITASVENMCSVCGEYSEDVFHLFFNALFQDWCGNR